MVKRKGIHIKEPFKTIVPQIQLSFRIDYDSLLIVLIQLLQSLPPSLDGRGRGWVNYNIKESFLPKEVFKEKLISLIHKFEKDKHHYLSKGLIRNALMKG